MAIIRKPTYAWQVVPGIELAQAGRWLQENPVKVLANTPSVQAVSDAVSGSVGAVFHEAGVLRLDGDRELRVSAACVVSLSEDGGGLHIADPAWRDGEVHVNWNSREYRARTCRGRSVFLPENV